MPERPSKFILTLPRTGLLSFCFVFLLDLYTKHLIQQRSAVDLGRHNVSRGSSVLQMAPSPLIHVSIGSTSSKLNWVLRYKLKLFFSKQVSKT